MIIDVLFFLLLLLAMVICGSLAMVGWFTITRGRMEYLPDGTPFKTGKLLKGWHFFWTQPACYQSYNVQGKPLLDIFFKLYNSGVLKEYSIRVSNLTTYILFEGNAKEVEKLKDVINQLSGARVDVCGDRMFFTQRKPVHRFPEWVRDPLSECPTCFASIYGSLFYWSVIGLCPLNFFWWSTAPALTSVIFWVVFCVSCAFLNTVLAKKI